MGLYLNPANDKFFEAVNSEIYVDKTELIQYTNSVIRTKQKYICVSRPRRFGKSMTADMLTAYYSCGCESRNLFENLMISASPDFDMHLNKYEVLAVNMQEFLSRTRGKGIFGMLEFFQQRLLRELIKEYPNIDYFDKTDLISCFEDVYNDLRMPFIIIIDEWDCVFREYRQNKEAQEIYLDFMRDFMKDKEYIALTYMTGILPIKKYGTHSALNMFDEFSMTDPGPLARFVGFTSNEVRLLCNKFDMDYNEVRLWYDGYHFADNISIYSPRSVVSAMLRRRFGNYWNQTESFEALKIYIEMNYDGLKDKIIHIMAGEDQIINIGKFVNDMITFNDADDVLTLLVHLGYLSYNCETEKVSIPNKEISNEYINAMEGAGWNEILDTIKKSEQLLLSTWRLDADAVAEGIQNAHMETSHLTYSDENALSYTISLAYYSARQYYTIIRELPSGSGFADVVFLPRKKYFDKPAMIVELKWNKSVQGAIAQIKNKKYIKALEDYRGNLLLVAVNYDKKKRNHQCHIEKFALEENGRKE